MRRLLAPMITLLLGVAACGGDSADTTAESDDRPNPTSVDGGSPGTASSATDDDDDEGDASGPSTARVTLGGQTYRFSTEGARVAQCKTDLFGVFSAQLPMVDGDGSIGIVILRDGTDSSVVDQVDAVRISIEDEDWFADEASDMFTTSAKLKAGMSQVDSAEIDGRTVRGTATFVRQLSLFTGEVETATGTFEATCGAERVS